MANMVVKGKLIKARRMVKEFKGQKSDEKLYITLAEVKLTDEQMKVLKDAFKESGKKFTPSWITDFEGFVNVATKFELPAKSYGGQKYDSLEDLIADEPNYYQADVRLSLNIKDGAIYPKAIVFDGEGKEFDPFADMDEELPFE